MRIVRKGARQSYLATCRSSNLINVGYHLTHILTLPVDHAQIKLPGNSTGHDIERQSHMTPLFVGYYYLLFTPILVIGNLVI